MQPMRGGSFDELLEGFLVEDSAVDDAVVDLAKRDQRGERRAPVAGPERHVLKEREEERGDFLGERRVRIAAEDRRLRTLDRIDQAELRLDDAGVRLMTAKLGGNRAVKLNHVLGSQVANSGISP